MASRSIDLGHVDLVSTTSGYELQLTSVASFTQQSHSSTQEAPSVLHALAVAYENQAWISRADDFQLVLCLQSAQGHAIALDGVIESLAERMSDSRFWSQLGLRPTCVRSPCGEVVGTRLVITELEHGDAVNRRKREMYHKLGADVPFYDVRPPPGTEELAIEAVYLTLTFSRPRKRKQRQTADDEVPSSDLLELLPQSDDHSGSAEQHSSQCTDSLYDTDDCMLDELEGSKNGQVLSPFRPTHEVPCTIQPEIYNDPPLEQVSGLPQNANEPCIADTESFTNDAIILVLIDNALRLAISTPCRLGQDLRVSGSESFRCLADIAPSLWCGDYLPSVVARACFLPTISHAIKSMGNRAKDRDLGIKICEIQRRLSQVRDSPSACEEAINLLQMKLWQLMQRGLRDTNKPRRLRPMRSVHVECFEDLACTDARDDSRAELQLLDVSDEDDECFADEELETDVTDAMLHDLDDEY